MEGWGGGRELNTWICSEPYRKGRERLYKVRGERVDVPGTEADGVSVSGCGKQESKERNGLWRTRGWGEETVIRIKNADHASI